MVKRLLRVAGLLLLLVPALSHAEAVTTQTRTFEVTGEIPLSCAFDSMFNFRLDSGEDPIQQAIVLGELRRSVEDSLQATFSAKGSIRLTRHGENGAVNHIEWGAEIQHASVSVIRTHTLNPPITFFLLASFGSFAPVAISQIDRTNTSLMTAVNLGSVDARNIIEARNTITFTVDHFVATDEESMLRSAIQLIWRPEDIPPPEGRSQFQTLLLYLAKAFFQVMRQLSVTTSLTGHYKAMPGPGGQNDILTLDGTTDLQFSFLCTENIFIQASIEINPF